MYLLQSWGLEDFMFQNSNLPQDNERPSPAGTKGWFAGMMTGQILGFAAAAVFAPSAIVIPALVVSTLVGGLLGGLAMTRVQQARLAKRTRPVEAVRERIFEALDLTDSKIGEMFIEEDFNVAANNNEPAQKAEKKLEHKLAPVAPQMRPF